MRYLKLTIAYDGTRYVGWQVQQNGTSIQQVLETAWQAVTGEALRITASGRTDSGVHALAQVCSLATNSALGTNRLLFALNANLPMDIRVLEVATAPEHFHAIRDAVRKTYRYQIQNGRILDVFGSLYRWHIPRPLDIEAMTRAAGHLTGKHDFSSFEAAGAPRGDSVRTVMDLSVTPKSNDHYQYIDIEVTADGFLYNMVRNIVGTLVVAGRGKQTSDWTRSVLAARDRSRAGDTAPAHGLFLVSVVYDF